MTEEEQYKVRSLGGMLASYLSEKPFSFSENAIPLLWDLVNEHRDAYIKRGHAAIDDILKQPDFPSEKWKKAIIDINNVINMMQGQE